MRFKYGYIGLLLACLWTGAALAASTQTAASQAAIRFGLFPSLIPRTLISMYDPLRLYLEQALGQPVQLYSSPDFTSFAHRTSEQGYDVVLTAPHLAYLASKNAGYIPVATYKNGIKAFLLVRNQNAGMRLESLRGKTVAGPDENALVTLVGEDMLQGHGLLPGRDYKIMQARGHQGAAMAVLNGEADLALVGNLPYNQLAANVKAALTVHTESITYPAQFFLVNKEISAAQRKKIQQALLEFADTEAGRKLIENNKFGGIVSSNGRELEKVRGIAMRVQKQLDKATPPL